MGYLTQQVENIIKDVKSEPKTKAPTLSSGLLSVSQSTAHISTGNKKLSKYQTDRITKLNDLLNKKAERNSKRMKSRESSAIMPACLRKYKNERTQNKIKKIHTLINKLNTASLKPTENKPTIPLGGDPKKSLPIDTSAGAPLPRKTNENKELSGALDMVMDNIKSNSNFTVEPVPAENLDLFDAILKGEIKSDNNEVITLEIPPVSALQGDFSTWLITLEEDKDYLIRSEVDGESTYYHLFYNHDNFEWFICNKPDDCRSIAIYNYQNKLEIQPDAEEYLHIVEKHLDQKGRSAISCLEINTENVDSIVQYVNLSCSVPTPDPLFFGEHFKEVGELTTLGGLSTQNNNCTESCVLFMQNYLKTNTSGSDINFDASKFNFHGSLSMMNVLAKYSNNVDDFKDGDNENAIFRWLSSLDEKSPYLLRSNEGTHIGHHHVLFRHNNEWCLYSSTDGVSQLTNDGKLEDTKSLHFMTGNFTNEKSILYSCPIDNFLLHKMTEYINFSRTYGEYSDTTIEKFPFPDVAPFCGGSMESFLEMLCVQLDGKERYSLPPGEQSNTTSVNLMASFKDNEIKNITIDDETELNNFISGLNQEHSYFMHSDENKNQMICFVEGEWRLSLENGHIDNLKDNNNQFTNEAKDLMNTPLSYAHLTREKRHDLCRYLRFFRDNDNDLNRTNIAYQQDNAKSKSTDTRYSSFQNVENIAKEQGLDPLKNTCTEASLIFIGRYFFNADDNVSNIEYSHYRKDNTQIDAMGALTDGAAHAKCNIPVKFYGGNNKVEIARWLNSLNVDQSYLVRSGFNGLEGHHVVLFSYKGDWHTYSNISRPAINPLTVNEMKELVLENPLNILAGHSWGQENYDLSLSYTEMDPKTVNFLYQYTLDHRKYGEKGIQDKYPFALQFHEIEASTSRARPQLNLPSSFGECQNTCAEDVLTSISKKYGFSAPIFNKKNYYYSAKEQADSKSNDTPLRTLHFNQIDLATPIMFSGVNANLSYEGHNEEALLTFFNSLDNKTCHLIRTGQNSHAGHFGLLYQKNNDWYLDNSSTLEDIQITDKNKFTQEGKNMFVFGIPAIWGIEDKQYALYTAPIPKDQNIINNLILYINTYRETGCEDTALNTFFERL